jgi:hypothetical protein
MQVRLGRAFPACLAPWEGGLRGPANSLCMGGLAGKYCLPHPLKIREIFTLEKQDLRQ